MCGMAPSPPQHTPLGSAHALPFSEPGSPASGRSLAGPGHAMLAHPHAHPGVHALDRNGPYGMGGMPAAPGYGHPVQIPPGYALVPAMPQMPVSPVSPLAHTEVSITLPHAFAGLC